MKRMECLEALGPLVRDELVVTALGGTTDEWRHVADRDANYYNICMGSNLPLAMGLALALPQRGVILLDTDGCQLMTLGALCTFANEAPDNLRAFVFDNGSYGYTGGQPTATGARADLDAIARGAGLEQVQTAHDLGEFEACAREALGSPGPWYTVAKIELVPGKFGGGGPMHMENGYRFRESETPPSTVITCS